MARISRLAILPALAIAKLATAEYDTFHAWGLGASTLVKMSALKLKDVALTKGHGGLFS
jgi:hypothetical protein